jgi:uncharacterized protein YbbK (DUF523 family)
VTERSGGQGPDQGCPDAEPVVLVSSCLLGVPCTHDSTGREAPAVIALGATRRLVPVCPETAGGLPTPRPPAERSADDGRVRTAAGDDVTDAYRRGAEHAVAVAAAVGARSAVLKARSPSCGCDEVYDGSFTRTKVAGMGVTAEVLRAAGITVVSEDDLAAGTAGPLGG